MPYAPRPLHRPLVLVAPDSFKGTFTASEVAGAICEGLISAGCLTDSCPVADGGEGTSEILAESLGGIRLPVRARDPLGRPIHAQLTMIGTTAVIDVAEASGLTLLAADERNPLITTTHGTGDLLIAARDHGASEILLAAGGSATVDGGAGALAVVEQRGGLRKVNVEILCDVQTPLEDAAAIYGPQKGASTPMTVAAIEARLEQLARSWPKDPRGLPMTGAAGGLAGGLWATLGAHLRSGAETVLDAVGFDARAASADAVVVGEGQLDDQTLNGKIVATIVARARSPVHAIVGRARLDPNKARRLGLRSVQEASDRLGLVEAGRRLGRQLRTAQS